MNDSDAIRLLKKHAPDPKTFEIVYSHVHRVHDTAMKIAANVDCDQNLVSTGALLHDIGRLNCPPGHKNSIFHGLRGALILRKLGYKKQARIAERHVGFGISIDDIKKQKLPLPLRDFVPITIEEKIVCYADKLAEQDKLISFEETLDRFKKEIGDFVEERAIKLREDLLSAGCKI